MADLNDMTLDKLKLWSTNALRVFLSMRKKSIKGNFDEIAARAFCCWEENNNVDVSAEQEQRRLLAEYQGKLVVEGDKIPDPVSIKDGWLTEKFGRLKWPSVYITDISDYLNTQNPETLMKRLLNEYKEGKAYRYFSSEWVKEVHYHDLDEHSDKCIVKSKVTPSQSVNNKAYDVWIVIRKYKNTVPGGQVLNAYCSCTAGMMGSCNHIAGVLFRIEYAVKTGMTRPASTSKSCEWTIPKKKTTVKLGKARDFSWKKAKYTQLPRNKDTEKETNMKKLNFTSLNKSHQNKVEDTEKLRNELKELLAEDMPNSCFMLLMNKKKSKKSSESENVKQKLPPTLNELGQKIKSLDISECAQKAEFKKQMYVRQDEIDSLNQETITQNKSESWKEHRRGRVTASNFHRICKRATSLKKDSTEDPTSVIKLVMGTTEGIQTHAMKHGISLEPVAKRNYKGEMKTVHKRFQSSDSGIILDKDQPFIAASPDLFVSCACCGDGLCEVKCPESIKDQQPSADNVPYLITKDGVISLKRNHPYFYQIQGQMGITKRNYCDLYIFTYHGSLILRIKFDSNAFSEIVQNVSWFWDNFIIDRLLNHGILQKKSVNENKLNKS